MRRSLLVVLFALGASGCVKHWYFVNPDVDERQFAQDQYACGQESTTTSTVVQFNRYSGSAGQRSQTDSTLFRTCMQARGYSTVKLPASEAPPPHHYYSQFDH